MPKPLKNALQNTMDVFLVFDTDKTAKLVNKEPEGKLVTIDDNTYYLGASEPVIFKQGGNTKRLWILHHRSCVPLAFSERQDFDLTEAYNEDDDILKIDTIFDIQTEKNPSEVNSLIEEQIVGKLLTLRQKSSRVQFILGLILGIGGGVLAGLIISSFM